MQIIPLSDAPSQSLMVALALSNCRLDIITRGSALYMDVYMDDVLTIGGVVCQNLNYIIRNTYLGFPGDLVFVDTQGSDDPTYPGIGSRFVLAFATNEELAA